MEVEHAIFGEVLIGLEEDSTGITLSDSALLSVLVFPRPTIMAIET